VPRAQGVLAFPLNNFSDLNIPINQGNDISPEGNAALNLSEYFTNKPLDLYQRCGEEPYTDRLDDITILSISPNGDLYACCFVVGNVYRESVTDIISRYNPHDNEMMSALLNGGLPELMELAKTRGIEINPDDHYSACSICREIIEKVRVDR
jgi:MoaA/NifB/PqqE/SkfB family radical SAM enzyme